MRNCDFLFQGENGEAPTGKDAPMEKSDDTTKEGA